VGADFPQHPMEQKMMKFWSIALICAGAIVGESAARAGCLDDIRAKGVLVAGLGNMGQKPLIWQDDKGNYQGYEWEVLKFIGGELGIPKQTYQVTEWTTLIPGLNASRWDIIMSAMIITQERAAGGDFKFTNPYFMFYDKMMVQSKSEIKSIADLKGKKVGSVLGTLDSLSAHRLAEDGAIGEAIDFNTYGDPFVALRNGQVSAVLLDQASYLGQQDTMQDLRVVGDPIPFIPQAKWADVEAKQNYVLGATGVGVRKNCDDLREAINAALAKLDSTGQRKALEEKFGLWDTRQEKLVK
jgi:ABC-type amino acid transport substrate-binding protein